MVDLESFSTPEAAPFSTSMTRGTGVGVVEWGRAGKGRRNQPVRSPYIRKTPHGKTNMAETIDSHHQRSSQNVMAGPVPECTEGVLAPIPPNHLFISGPVSLSAGQT